ncbi:GNAT family N-acetyltransferase [Sphingobium sp. Sx8-8]|uniref:GNAT family N-acetyltransferase n=1 Tax=Sphingobium sp. Sx8-8 TaxID=2933617 RepID=UPI001F582B82|nr:GNAT family N-acetyltransferase [Sphingobium sp. Sx8-8]
MKIRPVNAAEYPELASLWHESARMMDGGVTDLPSVEALLERIRQQVRNGWNVSVASDESHILGFAAIIPTRGILDQLFTAPHSRGRGIGSALLASVMAEMPAGFTLRTPAHNRRAQRFYEARGLRFLGDDLHPVNGMPVKYYAATPRQHVMRDSRPQIYLLRHGETEWNASGRFQGLLDSALTARGIEQAKAAGRRLASLIPYADAVYASPLGRARETCLHVTSFATYPQTRWDTRLQEVSIGSWNGLTEIDIEEGWPGLLDGTSAFDWFFRSPDGESYDAVVNRVRSWLSEIEGRVVVISHGLLSRIIRGEYLGLPKNEALALPVAQNVIWHLASGRLQSLSV